MSTSLVLKSASIQTALHARSLAVVDRLTSLEAGENFQLPTTCKFLGDTCPQRGQWRRKFTYYGQSMHGTDWPDRWLVEFGEAEKQCSEPREDS